MAGDPTTRSLLGEARARQGWTAIAFLLALSSTIVPAIVDEANQDYPQGEPDLWTRVGNVVTSPSGIGFLVALGIIVTYLLFVLPLVQRNAARKALDELRQDRSDAKAISLEPEIIGSYPQADPLPDFPDELAVFVPFVIWNHGPEDVFTVDLVSQMMGPEDAVGYVYPHSDIRLKWQQPNESGREQRIAENSQAKIDLLYLLPESKRIAFMRPSSKHEKWSPLDYTTDDFVTGDILFRVVGRPAWERYRFRLSVGGVDPVGLKFEWMGSSDMNDRRAS